MNKCQHKNLFIICENCNSPLVISESQERLALAKATAIHCKYCEHANADLEGLKEYAKNSRKRSKSSLALGRTETSLAKKIQMLKQKSQYEYYKNFIGD